ncbi:MAG TPA: MerR family transcriptional regulator [Terriglobales bacterium]|nr:MerR family transcriptional regulator [Terriglobales bacterium]
MYKVSQFAEKSGVTVRALHHYDRLGVLKPSGRTASGYRLYTDRDHARLQQIETLKFIGLSLRQIKDVLDGNDLDLGETLRLQRRLLVEKKSQVEQALRAIEQAERGLRSSSAPDWTALKNIIEVMKMQTNSEWMKKYYNEEAQAEIAKRAQSFTPEMRAKVQQDWKDLINDVETARNRNDDPAGTYARTLAERWAKLLKGFTGGNSEIQNGLNKLYADQGNWPSSFQKPFSGEVWVFIKKAMAAHGISCA